MKVYYHWHNYRYFPYEKELASRELRSLTKRLPTEFSDGLFLEQDSGWKEVAGRTTYFSFVSTDTDTSVIPLQARLEATGNGNHGSTATGRNSRLRRQSTRYSVHGLHEYRGKFNPQMVRAILNLLDTPSGARILDPFCGSGTTLVECAHARFSSVGFDINPLAIYVSKAKLRALEIAADTLGNTLHQIVTDYGRRRDNYSLEETPTTRLDYLQRWFDTDNLISIECLKSAIENTDQTSASIFLALASDLLREYSLQEPADLRIRRRRTPLPDRPLIEAFEAKSSDFIRHLQAAQSIVGVRNTDCDAVLKDIRDLSSETQDQFDIGVTSPPYATALPYIDTQRLSLVWLELCSPDQLHSLEAFLTGSREFVKGKKADTESIVRGNTFRIPERTHRLCITLLDSLAPSDGFRRKAVPYLLYRYFSDMQRIFRQLKPVFRSNAPFALVVGHNHTVIGGKRFDIDTPALLAGIAENSGWKHEESIPLQTYQRYDIHRLNAVKEETLLLLRNTDAI